MKHMDVFSVLQNGLSLCKFHHATYDHNIIRVNPNYEAFVRQDVLEEIDGPMFLKMSHCIVKENEKNRYR